MHTQRERGHTDSSSHLTTAVHTHLSKPGRRGSSSKWASTPGLQAVSVPRKHSCGGSYDSERQKGDDSSEDPEAQMRVQPPHPPHPALHLAQDSSPLPVTGQREIMESCLLNATCTWPETFDALPNAFQPHHSTALASVV